MGGRNFVPKNWIQILVKNTHLLMVVSRSLAKSRRKAKRPTVLSSLLHML